jgi:hypothetical protein
LAGKVKEALSACSDPFTTARTKYLVDWLVVAELSTKFVLDVMTEPLSLTAAPPSVER